MFGDDSLEGRVDRGGFGRKRDGMFGVMGGAGGGGRSSCIAMLDVVDDGPTDLERTMNPFCFERLERVLVRLLGPADHGGVEAFEGLQCEREQQSRRGKREFSCMVLESRGRQLGQIEDENFLGAGCTFLPFLAPFLAKLKPVSMSSMCVVFFA